MGIFGITMAGLLALAVAGCDRQPAGETPRRSRR